MIVCPASLSICVLMRLNPKIWLIWFSVMNCTSAPLRKITPVQPKMIVEIEIVRNKVVSIGRTSSYPTV